MQVQNLNSNITLFTAKTLKLNATVIDCGTFLIVIDSLLLTKDISILKDYILEKNKPVKYIINTHFHSDHCYGNSIIANSNTIVISHEKFLNTSKTEKNMLKPSHNFEKKNEKVRYPDLVFSDSIHLENYLEIFYTPGHSYDSCCIFDKKNSILWTGDTFLSSDNDFYSIPYFYWGNPVLHLESLRKLLTFKPESIISGHGMVLSESVSANLNEICLQIEYLELLITKFKQYKNSYKSIEEFKDYFAFNKFAEIYPIDKKLWVTQMHDLNITKLYSLKEEFL